MSTVRRVLHENGKQNYAAVTKPFLSNVNIKKSLQWGRIYAPWSSAQWDTVIFSDETSVTVHPKMQRKKVWRTEEECYNSCNLVPSFKSGYVSISVWAAFSARGRTPLVLVEGTMKQEQYQSILEANIVPFAIEHYGIISSVTFQQDNCVPHHSNSVQSYLEASSINLINWPAQSPDLNPIENAWSMLKRMLRRRQRFPTNTTELFNVLQEDWMSIPNSYFTNLVRSMSSR